MQQTSRASTFSILFIASRVLRHTLPPQGTTAISGRWRPSLPTLQNLCASIQRLDTRTAYMDAACVHEQSPASHRRATRTKIALSHAVDALARATGATPLNIMAIQKVFTYWNISVIDPADENDRCWKKWCIIGSNADEVMLYQYRFRSSRNMPSLTSSSKCVLSSDTSCPAGVSVFVREPATAWHQIISLLGKNNGSPRGSSRRPGVRVSPGIAGKSSASRCPPAADRDPWISGQRRRAPGCVKFDASSCSLITATGERHIARPPCCWRTRRRLLVTGERRHQQHRYCNDGVWNPFRIRAAGKIFEPGR